MQDTVMSDSLYMSSPLAVEVFASALGALRTFLWWLLSSLELLELIRAGSSCTNLAIDGTSVCLVVQFAMNVALRLSTLRWSAIASIINVLTSKAISLTKSPLQSITLLRSQQLNCLQCIYQSFN